MALAERGFNPAHRMIDQMVSSVSILPVEHRPTVKRLTHVSEMLDSELFTSEYNHVHVWSDFDGVFNDPWSRTFDIRRFQALSKLAAKTDHFHIVTARIPYPQKLKHLYPENIPFFPSDLQFRLTRFMNTANSSCRVEFHFGLEKLIKKSAKEQFIESVATSLSDHHPVVLLGSSIFDRRRFTQLMKGLGSRDIGNFSRLFYFDTGHLFI